MMIALSLVLVLLCLVRKSVQGPIESIDQVHPNLQDITTTRTDILNPSHAIPLYDLVAGRIGKKSTKPEVKQFKIDFANHAEIKKVNLNDEEVDKTIEHLLDIKKKVSNGDYSKNWGKKFTIATYHLLEEHSTNPTLLNAFKTYNHHKRKELNNEKKGKRINSEEGEILRAKQRSYEAKLRKKRKTQSREGSVKDLPLIQYIGRAKTGKDRLTAEQVIEKAKEFEGMYTTGLGFHLAINGYLTGAKYNPREVKLALTQKSRDYHLANMRVRNSHRYEIRRIKKGKGLLTGTDASSPSSPNASKQARISQYLEETKWWQTDNW